MVLPEAVAEVAEWQMGIVFLLSHPPPRASASSPHLSQAPRMSSSPASQLRKDWETALTFILRFTSN